ncbi:efflux system transcriptional repressor MexL [Methyloparacoccus murrellii]
MKTPSPSKRQAILDAARQAFLASGYNGTSMDAIAETAPVSKPTLYSHFGSKHELFVAVIADQCKALFSTLSEAPLAHREPARGLRAIADAYVDLLYAPDSLALYRLLIAEQQHFPELREQVWATSAGPMLQLLSRYLAELHDRGALSVHQPDSASQLLLGMLQGAAHFRCLIGLQQGLPAAERERLIEAAVTLFLEGHRP